MRKIQNKSFTILLVKQQEQEPSGQLEERDSLFRLQPNLTLHNHCGQSTAKFPISEKL